MAMNAFARCKVDVILTGHLHVSRISNSARRYDLPGYSALFIQAGTATSVRQRGELNAWNLIRVEEGALSVDCYSWSKEAGNFTVLKTDKFIRGGAGWSVASGRWAQPGRWSLTSSGAGRFWCQLPLERGFVFWPCSLPGERRYFSTAPFVQRFMHPQRPA